MRGPLSLFVGLSVAPFVALTAAELSRALAARPVRSDRAADLHARAAAIADELDLGLVRARLAPAV